MEGREHSIHYCQLRDRECLPPFTSYACLHANDVMRRVYCHAKLELLADYQKVMASFLERQLHVEIDMGRGSFCS
jgi:hypothetical protein